MVTSFVLLFFQGAWASVNIPLHHWAYEAIERLTALGIIDQAMVTAKPYSRKQAAKYVARAIERIRADEIRADGREALAEPSSNGSWRNFAQNSWISERSPENDLKPREQCATAPVCKLKSMRSRSVKGKPSGFKKTAAVNIMPMAFRIRRMFAAGLKWETGPPLVQPNHQ